MGEIVTCDVDLAMFHDSSGSRRLKPMLEELGALLWDASKIVPEADDESRRIVRIARDWDAQKQLPHVYDSVGICHVVLPEHGHVRPDMFCVGGAFGAYMFGIGSTEMPGVAVSGQIWVKVPQTSRMRWHGRLARGVTAKDMIEGELEDQTFPKRCDHLDGKSVIPVAGMCGKLRVATR
ncbi:isopropylmalate isomerase large subunit [Caballeronia hypogeia]|uniref:Isopropylmalate isomerase large subunit n=1 Tax=Caballeronia hypogeia TaxID=1777140 RepID=A0A158BVY8_9BURK|nr:isopropylmalate isomerase large subunit [Caballeronia hypogeia]